MRIVIAPNAFKGSLTALEAAQAIERGIRRIVPDAEPLLLPAADGGDGTLDVLVHGTDGQIFTVEVADPLGRPVQAQFGMLGDGKTAVVEMAAASGLRLLTLEERDPASATTFGTGQLIRAALDRGCETLLMGIGGSATVDGGAGIAQALGIRLLDASGNELPRGGAALVNLHAIDRSSQDARLKNLTMIVLCDVDNPLTGKNGAAHIFGPQKGASPAMVEQLDAALAHYADVLRDQTGIAVQTIAGGGAAGGIAAGMVALFGATLEPGAQQVLKLLDFEAQLTGADLVITGEGSLDDQTIHGKAPIVVAQMAKKHAIPVVGLAGRVAGNAIYAHGIDAALAIVPAPMPLEEAVQQAAALVEDTAERLMRLIKIDLKA
jgi:glycerate kinase